MAVEYGTLSNTHEGHFHCRFLNRPLKIHLLTKKRWIAPPWLLSLPRTDLLNLLIPPIVRQQTEFFVRASEDIIKCPILNYSLWLESRDHPKPQTVFFYIFRWSFNQSHEWNTPHLEPGPSAIQYSPFKQPNPPNVFSIPHSHDSPSIINRSRSSIQYMRDVNFTKTAKKSENQRDYVWCVCKTGWFEPTYELQGFVDSSKNHYNKDDTRPRSNVQHM